MPVTEFVTFRLKAPYTLDNGEVRSNFQKLSSLQSKWSKSPLTFYTARDDPSVIHLLSGWDDVPAHMKWVESEGNQTLIRLFDPILSIVDFTHLEIDFAAIPSDTELLVYRKGVADVGEEISSKIFDAQPEGVKLWSGQGKAVDGTEVYHLMAYRNFDFETTPDQQWKFMRRIYS